MCCIAHYPSLLADFVGVAGANRGSPRLLTLFVVMAVASMFLHVVADTFSLMVIIKAVVVVIATRVRNGFIVLRQQREQMLQAYGGEGAAEHAV